MTASAAATGFLSLPPGPLHTPQRLSLNSINDRSSFPFTAAYQWRAGTSLGCLVMLWWLVQASGTFQPQLCLRPAVPRCPHAHRCQDTQSPGPMGTKSSLYRTWWGTQSPLQPQDAGWLQALPHPALLSGPQQLGGDRSGAGLRCCVGPGHLLSLSVLRSYRKAAAGPQG